MGMTLRAGKPNPYEVRKEVDNYENTSLFDNMFINGKSVASRKQRRERRREQAQQKRQLDLQKNSDMTKKAPKLANNSQNMKQAAWIKLAQVKLAINYVLRNRGMSKSAAGIGGFMQGFAPIVQRGFNRFGQSIGNMANNVRQGFQNNVRSGINQVANRASGFMPRPTNNSMPGAMFSGSASAPAKVAPLALGDRGYTQQRKQQLGLTGPTSGLQWDKVNKTYNLNGMQSDMAREAMKEERARIESAYSQLTPEEREYYGEAFRTHIGAIDQWERSQELGNNPALLNQQMAGINNRSRLANSGSTYVPMRGPDQSSGYLYDEASPYADKVRADMEQDRRANQIGSASDEDAAASVLSGRPYDPQDEQEPYYPTGEDFYAPIVDNGPRWNPYGPVGQVSGENYYE